MVQKRIRPTARATARDCPYDVSRSLLSAYKTSTSRWAGRETGNRKDVVRDYAQQEFTSEQAVMPCGQGFGRGDFCGYVFFRRNLFFCEKKKISIYTEKITKTPHYLYTYENSEAYHCMSVAGYWAYCPCTDNYHICWALQPIMPL